MNKKGDYLWLKHLENGRKNLIAQMTLEEKVSQTLHGAAEIERLGIPKYNWWNEALHELLEREQRHYFHRQLVWLHLLMKNWLRRWLISLPLKDVQNIICM